MPAKAEKLVIDHGLLAGVEGGGYAQGGTLTGADNALLVEEPVVIYPEYIFDGARSAEIGGGGLYPRAQPGGRHATGITVPVLIRGLNAAYGASARPEIDPLLQMCGHTATVDATVGAESVTYTPDSDIASATSGVIEGYTRGEVVELVGAYGSFSFEIDGPSFARAEATLSGIITTNPADGAVPSLTIPTHQPPKAENMTVDIGNYTTGRVSGIRFAQNRNTGVRPDVVAADGIAGITPGRRAPTLEIDVEATPLEGSPFHGASGLDPLELHRQATQLAVNLYLPTTGTQYNRFKLEAGQAVMSQPPEPGEVEEVAMWTLFFELTQTAPGADDEYSLIFD